MVENCKRMTFDAPYYYNAIIYEKDGAKIPTTDNITQNFEAVRDIVTKYDPNIKIPYFDYIGGTTSMQ